MFYVKAKQLLSPSNGMNIYRGCTHGCIYCDSRSLCYGFTHAFEDIEVKENAPELLEKALASKRKKCMIATGSMSDPYLPLEERLQLTRSCLDIIDRYEFGVTLLTKSDRVLRDMDRLKSIHRHSKAVVQMTLTTYDDALCRVVEPNVCPTSARVEALKRFRDEGIPTVVWLCPILPYINDTEENISGILDQCMDAGVKGILNFGMGLTLRDGNREYYYAALDRHFPGLKEKYIRRYGNAYEIASDNTPKLTKLFADRCRAAGILWETEKIFEYLRKYESRYDQISLF